MIEGEPVVVLLRFSDGRHQSSRGSERMRVSRILEFKWCVTVCIPVIRTFSAQEFEAEGETEVRYRFDAACGKHLSWYTE